MTGAQEVYKRYLQEHKMVRARELIRLGMGWDVRKAICRLRAQGCPIRNIAAPCHEAIYVWVDGGQMKLNL